MVSPIIISALCTPLDEDESLDLDSFARHLEQQRACGIDGMLVGGSMGAMQMLRDETYRQLVQHATELADDGMELLIGVGDTSFSRTIDRIDSLPTRRIDGVVVLPPFMNELTQEELYSYYSRLASHSPFPIYLYDLPHLSRNSFDKATVQKLSDHPNIHGIKCSSNDDVVDVVLGLSRHDFRVIVARPRRVATLLDRGVTEHLDGIFALAPRWVTQLRDGSVRNDSVAAYHRQKQLDSLLDLVTGTPHSVYAAFTVLMNRAGISGNMAPAPFQRFSKQDAEELISQPIAQNWLADHSIGPPIDATRCIST